MIVHAAAMVPHNLSVMGASARVIASRPQLRRPALAAGQHGGAVFTTKELSTELGQLTLDGNARLLGRSTVAAAVAAPTTNPWPSTEDGGDGVDDEDAVSSARKPTTTTTSSGRHVRRTARAAPTSSDTSASSMKRTRSKPEEKDRRRPAKRRSAKAARGQPGEIRSPTARTLLRMLRVGTGEATANDTNKRDAEAAILRLAGEFTPHDVLAKRYAGREALQVLLTQYLQKPVTFQQASECFHNPHNRGLEATEVFLGLLGDKSWPPYPENAILPAQGEDGDKSAASSDCDSDGYASGDEEDEQDSEVVERRRRRRAAKLVAEYREVITTGVRTTPLPSQRAPAPTADSPTTRAVSKTASGNNATSVGAFRIVDEFRPVITTGLAKAGTAFQVDSDLANYARTAGARHATLELRSLQLMSHNLTAPAALVTVKRECSDVSYAEGTFSPKDKPISLTTLRCRGFLAQKVPVISLDAAI